MISKNPIGLIVPNKLKVFKYIGEHKGQGVASADITKLFPFLNKEYTHNILLDLESIGLIYSWKHSHKNRKVDLTPLGSDGYDTLFYGKIKDLFEGKEESQDGEDDKNQIDAKR